MITSEKIPAVFIHTGFPDYLKKTVACAKEGHNRVILLGDSENEKIQADAWYPMANYSASCFEAFRDTYLHLSENPEWFELLCFERYFILLEFMKQNDLTECFMIDSDVLVYHDLTQLACWDFNAGGGIEEITVNPCILYWKSEALEDFTSFCLTQYRDPEKRRLLEQTYLQMQKEKPYAKINICDMLLLKRWITTTNPKWKDFFAKNTACVIDGNINEPRCADTDVKIYQMAKEPGIKQYRFRDSLPFLVDDHGKEIPVFAIHCQGTAKKYINLLYDRRSPYF